MNKNIKYSGTGGDMNGGATQNAATTDPVQGDNSTSEATGETSEESSEEEGTEENGEETED